LAAWLEEELFWTDAALRRDRLEALQDAVREAPVDTIALERVGAAIVEVWGGADTMVRLRSSSNAEDALGFSGAGLYTSVRACWADDLDGDDEGPSRCDRFEDTERTVADGLREVWASTWGVRAFEERDWYGIDARDVGMGVLINDRAASELLNVVAFSGAPGVPGDSAVHIDAQIGDLEVVSASPGVTPERLRVQVDGGEVGLIQRFADSSVMPPGQVVVEDDVAAEIARTLRALEGTYPIDDPAAAGQDVLLDTEWKVTRDGRLVIKQIRPFVRGGLR
jgi:phosphoenolpyruvate synthase/pyruvate phosphate dikinase